MGGYSASTKEANLTEKHVVHSTKHIQSSVAFLLSDEVWSVSQSSKLMNEFHTFGEVSQ